MMGGPSGSKFRLYEPTDRQVEVYTDGVQGVVAAGPIIKINWFSRGSTPPVTGPQQIEERDVVVRTVMGLDTFFAVLDFLKSVEAELRQPSPASELEGDEEGSE